MKMSRKDFLFGLGGLAAGAAAAVGGRRALDRWGSSPQPAAEDEGTVSYAQSGEDLVAYFIFDHLKIRDVTYLDIGAFDPVRLSNTYFFYQAGHRGVLVEPNPAMCEKLRAVRPQDKTLAAGIGTGPQREADYYVMSEPSWNTFSKEDAERKVRSGEGTILEVVKRPLLDVNAVMAEHFRGVPSFLSVDVEGLDLDILRSIDYARFRPKVVCVETLVATTNRTVPDIPAFMEKQGYVARGGSFVNTIFVDAQIL